MLTNLFIFLAFTSNDIKDNQQIDEDGMIQRTYYVNEYRAEGLQSFSEAFRQARKEKGPGQIFKWNNKYYTTNYYYETIIVIADEVIKIDKESNTYKTDERFTDMIAVRSFKDSDLFEIDYSFLNEVAKK